MGQSKSQRPRPVRPKQLSCEVCKKEIPGDVAHAREGPDYIINFCSLQCLDEWRQAHPGEDVEGQRNV